ncbi:MAG: hypothetical protein LUH40_02400 [Clostridiales bacterium]|nr:hypothetical protein [Clostridiales bacterium]
MYILKLTGVRSYSGIVRATAAQPFVEVETEAQAQELIATRHFEMCSSETVNIGVDDAKSSQPDYEALSKMTKAELTEYAEREGIAVKDCKTKADILSAISIAFGGSASMIALER